MPTGQQYASTAPQTTLNGGISAGTNPIVVNNPITGFPSTPFTICIDPGQSTQELCDVTSAPGNSWTVTRGVDGTTAQSHGNGAQVIHAAIARDFREARAHIDASSGVHGVTGAVVGTVDTQSLSNKTLASPTVTSPTVTGGSLSGTTIAASGTVTSGGLTATNTGAATTTRIAGGVSGAPPSSGTFNAGDQVLDAALGGTWYTVAGGSPGVWLPSEPKRLGIFTSVGGESFFEFTSIPATFTQLMVTGSGRSSASVIFSELTLKINLDTGAHYSSQDLSCSSGGSTVSAVFSGANQSGGAPWTFPVAGGNLAPTTMGGGTLWLPNYAQTTFAKNYHADVYVGDSGSTAKMGQRGGSWSQTAAINRLTFTLASGTFVSGSQFTLYGIP